MSLEAAILAEIIALRNSGSGSTPGSSYFWPCFQGENYPPALSGSTPPTYSRLNGPSVLKFSQPGAVATWNAYAPTGPDKTKTTMVMQCDFYMGANQDLIFGFGTPTGSNLVNGSAGVELITSNSQAAWRTGAGSGSSYTNLFTFNTWHTLTINTSSSGGTFAIDGTTITGLQSNVPYGSWTASAALFAGCGSSNSGGAVQITNVYASWK